MGLLTYDVLYERSMWQLMLHKKFPPLRRMRWCCDHLKERRSQEYGTAILALGVRKYESVRRATMKTGGLLRIVMPRPKSG